ncbi:MAG: transcription factor FapR [Acetobacteraceae bacterium]|nr:transcription factor FapR [Acetobacteraceae bacterium]
MDAVEQRGTRHRGLSRRERQEKLRSAIEADPFSTDEELAHRFGVSVQTIRLDRLALGIPEVRERTRAVARRTLNQVKSMGTREVVGELLELELGRGGISLLQTTSDMAFERSRVVRSQHIFAQADSLALAIVDAPAALTGLANAKFKRPVQVGERLVARAEMLRQKGNKMVVLVQTRVKGETVFRGKFVVAALA